MSQKNTFVCSILLCLLGFSLQSASPMVLTIQPLYIHVRPNTPATMLCTLRDGVGGRVALAGCELRDYYTNVTWDLNRGPASPSVHHSGSVYHGSGLQNGDCGLTVGGVGWKWNHMLLGCRVRPAGGGEWRYAAMMVEFSYFRRLQYSLQPPGATLVLPGSDVTLVGRAERQLSGCSFVVPPDNTGINLDAGHASGSNTQYRYSGGGLERNECGITLLSVQPSTSGFVRGRASSRATPVRHAHEFVELIVATPPDSPPRLTLTSPQTQFHSGDSLDARCAVSNARPRANITWLLAGRVVRDDDVNEAAVDSEWRWNHQLHSIEQLYSRRLSMEDDGKVLKCRSGHVALPSGAQDSNEYVIRVQDPCRPNPCGPHSACRVTGLTAVCSCLPHRAGSPPSCRPECSADADCPATRACVDRACRDPCVAASCGEGAICRVIQHYTFCLCPEGFVGDPYTLCKDEPCGKRNLDPALISGGQEAKDGEFPWHAAVFKVTRDATHILLCGGTLVKPNIVITAAHCVHDQGLKRLRDLSSVKIALGKLLPSWEADLNDTAVQRFDVAAMFVPDDYRGSHHDYRSDVAVVQLATRAVLSRKVNVACVDWANSFSGVQLRTGNNGTVAGWGITYNATTRPPSLQWIDLPWIDLVTCVQATASFNRRYLTRDKFCAGYLDRGLSVCQGDSGGGLLFINRTSNRYYLRGVVSTNLAYNVQPWMCSSDHFTSFTSVADHVEWIRGLLKT